MNDDQTPPERRCPFWIKAALALSLIANVVVIGVVIGHGMKEEPKRLRGTERRINWIMSYVPEARKDEAGAFFDERREQVRELRQGGDEVWGQLLAAIRAEPFDQTAMQVAVDQRIERSMARRELIYGGMVELVAGFTPAERAEFADRMEAGYKAWRERRRGGE